MNKRLSIDNATVHCDRPPIYPIGLYESEDSSDEWASFDVDQETTAKENIRPGFLPGVEERPLGKTNKEKTTSDNEDDDLCYSAHSSRSLSSSSDDLYCSKHSGSSSLQMLNISSDDGSDLDLSMEHPSEDIPKRAPLKEVIDLCGSP